jgi:TRAP transporter 4TM/12TM fusion protein
MEKQMVYGTTDGPLLERILGYSIIVLAVGYALFHLWLAGAGVLLWLATTGANILSLDLKTLSDIPVLSVEAARHMNLIGSMVLIFLLYPLSRQSPRHWKFGIDVLLIVFAIVAGAWLEIQSEELLYRESEPNSIDMFLGIGAILLTFEIGRRAIGLPIVITVLVFVAYAYFGDSIPGYWGHRGQDLEALVNAFYIIFEGIYGAPLGVVVEFVVLFVIFGAFLQKTGGGDFFIALAHAITGPLRGGPAKTAVVASALMGSISGSSTANVVTTGSFTIPMMKEAGYPPHIAAGVEVASSVGGVLLPPVMGAAAFLMVGLTALPYTDIIKAATLPAILYFISVYAQVHFTACRLGLGGTPFPSDYWSNLARVVIRGLPYLIPLATLVYLLLIGRSAQFAAFAAILLMIVMSFIRKETRMGPTQFIEALQTGAKNALPVAAACACVGMIIGVVDLTGVGVKFSALMTTGTGGSVFLAIILVALASLVLGIELPISASYLVIAILAAPALVDLGVPLIPAHLICMWFAIDAAVTPPVCITSYVAAGVANSDPFKTAVAGWKTAKGLYVVPFLMAYTPITMNGAWPDVVMAFTSGAIGLISLAAAWEGEFIVKATVIERLILVGVVVTAIDPSGPTDYIGIAGFLLVVVMQYMRKHRASGVEGTPPAG